MLISIKTKAQIKSFISTDISSTPPFLPQLSNLPFISSFYHFAPTPSHDPLSFLLILSLTFSPTTTNTHTHTHLSYLPHVNGVLFLLCSAYLISELGCSEGETGGVWEGGEKEKYRGDEGKEEEDQYRKEEEQYRKEEERGKKEEGERRRRGRSKRERRRWRETGGRGGGGKRKRRKKSSSGM